LKVPVKASHALKITDRIYQVGGPQVSHPYDGTVYLLDYGETLLVDAGLGVGTASVVANIEGLGYDPRGISKLVLTHCHIDHIGGARFFRDSFGIPLIMHSDDAAKAERGDTILTAAYCFGVPFSPLHIDDKLEGEEGIIDAGKINLMWLHTPGHSPGSISLYLDHEGLRILFAQDIQAPLLEHFDCDPQAWWTSVHKLVALNADILCDGHSGAWHPAGTVREYLQYAMQTHSEQ
jgi:glyoxylase-like metal-dependent hydrolase (beta-lactamase superfamily II)